MTAPDTDVEKQAKRHYGPLIGYALGGIVVIALVIYWASADEVTEVDAASGAATTETATD